MARPTPAWFVEFTGTESRTAQTLHAIERYKRPARAGIHGWELEDGGRVRAALSPA
jgi:hypothetical protein